MADNKASIVLSATDRVSTVLANVAGRMEKINRIGKNMGFQNVSAGMRMVSEQLGGVGKSFGMFKKSLMFSGAALGGIAAVSFGFFKIANDAHKAAAQVDNLSKKFQVDSEFLQVLGDSVTANGGSMEDAAAAIGKLKKAQQETLHGNAEMAEAFRGVGLSVEDLKGMKPEDMMRKMADAFKGSEKDLAKQAVLLKLFGKSGESLMATLNAGGEDLSRRWQEMQEDGRIFSKEQLETAPRFSGVWQRVTGTFEGLKNMIGLDLAEALIPVLKNTMEWMKANRELIKGKFQEFLKKLPKIIETVGAVLSTLWGVVEKVAGAFKWVSDIIGTSATVWLTLGTLLAMPLVSLGLMIAKLVILAGSFSAAGAASTGMAGQIGKATSAAKGLLGNLGAIAAAGAAGYAVGGVINDGINAGMSKLAGREMSIGTWLAEKINGPEPDINAPVVKPAAAASAPRLTAEQVAAGSKNAPAETIKNELVVTIDQKGRATVSEMKTSNPGATTMQANTGLAMAGGA